MGLDEALKQRLAKMMSSIGQRVLVDDKHQGVLRYFGHHGSGKGICCGVELDKPDGTCNGSTGGFRYFECAANHGVVLTPQRVKLVSELSPSAAAALQSTASAPPPATTAPAVSAAAPAEAASTAASSPPTAASSPPTAASSPPSPVKAAAAKAKSLTEIKLTPVPDSEKKYKARDDEVAASASENAPSPDDLMVMSKKDAVKTLKRAKKQAEKDVKAFAKEAAAQAKKEAKEAKEEAKKKPPARRSSKLVAETQQSLLQGTQAAGPASTEKNHLAAAMAEAQAQEREKARKREAEEAKRQASMQEQTQAAMAEAERIRREQEEAQVRLQVKQDEARRIQEKLNRLAEAGQRRASEQLKPLVGAFSQPDKALSLPVQPSEARSEVEQLKSEERLKEVKQKWSNGINVEESPAEGEEGEDDGRPSVVVQAMLEAASEAQRKAEAEAREKLEREKEMRKMRKQLEQEQRLRQAELAQMEQEHKMRAAEAERIKQQLEELALKAPARAAEQLRDRVEAFSRPLEALSLPIEENRARLEAMELRDAELAKQKLSQWQEPEKMVAPVQPNEARQEVSNMVAPKLDQRKESLAQLPVVDLSSTERDEAEALRATKLASATASKFANPEALASPVEKKGQDDLTQLMRERQQRVEQEERERLQREADERRQREEERERRDREAAENARIVKEDQERREREERERAMKEQWGANALLKKGSGSGSGSGADKSHPMLATIKPKGL